MFRINWADVFFGVAGIAIGVYLNNQSRKIEDQKLLDELKAELNSIRGTSTSTTGRAMTSVREAQLEYTISVLENKKYKKI